MDCSHCGFPIHGSASGLRHYGTHIAHQENECLRLLMADRDRLRAEVEALRSDAERKRIKLENMGDVITSLRSEVELYRGESERFHGLLNSVPLPPYAITYERGWELIYMFQAAAIDASRAAQGLTNPK